MSSEEQQQKAGIMGTTTVEGHKLSIFNTLYLWQQAGRALLQVGGCNQWRKAKRAVRKGEHAAGYIYVPIGNKVEEKTENADGEKDNTRPFFKLVPVFDIGQTVEIQ
jgi:antirestriction protein ArdC